MRRIPLLGVASVIGLTSLVVLGSSPRLVSEILSSVRSNPVTRVFLLETKPDSGNLFLKERETDQSGDSKTPSDTSVPEVPESVLWSVIFSLPQRLDAAAEKARGVGEDDSLWSHYFVRQARISPVSSQLLRETSARFSDEVAPIDQQATLVVRQLREKNPQPSSNPDVSIPEVSAIPDELKSLQNQKDEITLRHRDSFRGAIGEEEFAKFSEFLTNEFAKGFVRHEIKSGERTPHSVPANNGFEPFGGTNKGGDRQ